MTDTQELLEQSFEINLNNYGPEDVERLNDWAINAYAALEALQAEVVRLRVIAKEASEYATKHQTEVLRLQAQLAAAQGQDLLEIMCARIKAADDAMADGDYMLDSDDCISVIRGTWKPPMLNDKPAAPIPQPKMVTPYITQEHFDKAFPVNVPPSQALSLDLLERLSKTLTRLGYATPEGGMEHFNADLANQLYNLCRAVDSIFDREQPPAQCDTAITYMTGYSDGREWAKPSQALVVEPVYQYQLANGNWIDQTKESYDYNVKHGQATVRMLYATPQAAPLYAKEQQ